MAVDKKPPNPVGNWEEKPMPIRLKRKPSCYSLKAKTAQHLGGIWAIQNFIEKQVNKID